MCPSGLAKIRGGRYFIGFIWKFLEFGLSEDKADFLSSELYLRCFSDFTYTKALSSV